MGKTYAIKRSFGFFLLLFFILNLFQSYFSGLLEDEAYYWVWSQHLAFGYFDHPPLVALWVWLGDLFFNDELGVRFMATLSFSAMLWIIWQTIDLKNKKDYTWLFFVLVISLAMLNIYGFITTPDTPLLFFTALFLYSYKKFLQRENWQTILLFGFSMAGMLYSKYHGILVIGFVVLSNLKLLRNYRFWLSGLFGLALFLPHLYWQYLNDYPSFRYHLIERGAKSYKPEYTLMHFVNQIAIVGITFPLIYYAFFKEKAQNTFEKGLKYIVYGFIIFFFFSTFKSNPQAQWTVVILIPLLIFSFRFFVQHPQLRKKLVIVATVQLGILLLARLFFASEKLSPVTLEPHLAATWVPKLKEKTQSKPLVFTTYAYRNASVYRFYTGIKTHVYSNLTGRKSEYDLGNYERDMQGENVYAVSPSVTGPIQVQKGSEILQAFPIDHYTTFTKVTCRITAETLNLTPGSTAEVQFEFHNVYGHPVSFENVVFSGVFQTDRKKMVKRVALEVDDLSPVPANTTRTMTARFTVPEINGEDDQVFRIGLRFYGLPEGFQGNRVKVNMQH